MLQIKVYKPTSHKIKALIYGDSGSGKTSFGGTAPNVIFASAEAGLLSVANKRVSYADIKTVQHLRELLKFLQGEHSFDTVVLDSITEINDIIKAEIERKKGKPMQLQDWGVLAKDIERILRAFRGLDMNVIMIAQEKIIDDDGKIAKIVPDLNGKAASKIAYFMDIVGHMEIQGDGTYIINLSGDKGLVTKDRTGMLGSSTVPDFTKWLEVLEDMEIVEVEEIIEELDMNKGKEVEKEEVEEEVEKEVKEVKEVEEVEEDKFGNIYEEIKMCANLEHLNLVLDNLKKEMNNKTISLTVDQKNDIASLKKDMIASFESKTKEKPKTPVKKTPTKKVETK